MSSQDPVVTADITSIGGAAFDVFIRAPHETIQGPSGSRFLQFPLGAKIKVESVIQGCGGGAANTSVGFARLGMTARFCGVMGDDEWGQKIAETLKKERVLTDAAIVVEGETSSFSIILVDSASGERTILYSPNVNAHLREPVFPKELLKKSRWLFLNHLADASSGIIDHCEELIHSSRNAEKIRFAWNPGGTQIREGMHAARQAELLAHTDILFLNAEEASVFTGEALSDNRAEAIHHALRKGAAAGVKLFCITDAENGAYLSDGKEVFFGAPPKTKIVDTTGAGDAFAVGVTWGVGRNLPLQEALIAGMLNAASVIGVIGTQPGLLSENEMRLRLSQTPLSIQTSSL